MGRKDGELPWAARVARTAHRWSVSPLEAASMVDGYRLDYEEFEAELLEVELCDRLEEMHREITRYDAAVKAGQHPPVPYGADAWGWYEDLKRDADPDAVMGTPAIPTERDAGNAFVRSALTEKQHEARLNG